ncbi:MAG: hypothetical protein LBP87_15030 [Planctomycetaceae bacterium]|jgi:hypothetical protein|nr:hypothetical protein [Planctomycetaceae bacterium]
MKRNRTFLIFIYLIGVVFINFSIAQQPSIPPLPSQSPTTPLRSPQSVAQDNSPDSTGSNNAATNRELAEQLRRARTQQRSPRRTSVERQGLITMNLSGLETFGDALGPDSNSGINTITVSESITLGNNFFFASTINNSNTNGIFQSKLNPLIGGPAISLVQNHDGIFIAGTPYKIYLTNVPAVLKNEVVAHLGQIASGGSAGAGVTVTSGLIDFIKNNPIEPEKLNLNTENSFVQLEVPAGGAGNYNHATDFQDGQISYDYYAQYEIPMETGGTTYGLGRQKITENMTPFPTDRLIFDYSFFHNVPIPYRRMSVNRYTMGFEKTFLDKNFSFEMRLPLAATLDHNIYTDNSNKLHVLQVGDMTMILKYLLFRSKKITMTLGLGISVPLAEDTHLYDAVTNREVIRRQNESCHLMPYVGLLYFPFQNERTFFQAYFQVDGTVNGDSAYVADILSADQKMISLGKIFDRTFSYTSLSLGYWLYRNYDRDGRLKRGVNIMSELHWTQSLDRAKGIRNEQGNYQFLIGADRGNYSVLNSTFGLRFLMNEKTNIGIGYSLPFSNQRQFDGECRLTFNRYF